MKLAQDNFTITTIYFDGQFWSAFIQKSDGGEFFTGRYVFGEEPSNPHILDWAMNEFTSVPMFKTDITNKIRLKNAAECTTEGGWTIPKSFAKYKEAQKLYLTERKTLARQEKRSEARQKYLQKQQKKKDKRKH